MSDLMASDKGGSNFKPVPAGMHLARCYRVIDLGTQKTSWQGVEKAAKKVQIVWELHGEDADGTPLTTDDGRPLSVQRRFTPSLGPKAKLREILVAWRGRPFTPDELEGFKLQNILGAWAMISVAKSAGNNGKEYTNIMSVNPVPASIKKAGLPEAHNKAAIFAIENPDMELFETFSNGLQDKIRSSPEWQAREGKKSGEDRHETQGSSFDDMNDDIPF